MRRPENRSTLRQRCERSGSFASDGKCIVVDIEPTGKDKTVTKVGKDYYQTPDQAEADVKQPLQNPEISPRASQETPNKILDVWFGSLADVPMSAFRL
jgi:hypothetical protein